MRLNWILTKKLAKLLILNGLPEKFLVCKTRFVSYLQNKKLRLQTRKLENKITIHLATIIIGKTKTVCIVDLLCTLMTKHFKWSFLWTPPTVK